MYTLRLNAQRSGKAIEKNKKPKIAIVMTSMSDSWSAFSFKVFQCNRQKREPSAHIDNKQLRARSHAKNQFQFHTKNNTPKSFQFLHLIADIVCRASVVESFGGVTIFIWFFPNSAVFRYVKNEFDEYHTSMKIEFDETIKYDRVVSWQAEKRGEKLMWSNNLTVQTHFNFQQVFPLQATKVCSAKMGRELCRKKPPPPSLSWCLFVEFFIHIIVDTTEARVCIEWNQRASSKLNGTRHSTYQLPNIKQPSNHTMNLWRITKWKENSFYLILFISFLRPKCSSMIIQSVV